MLLVIRNRTLFYDNPDYLKTTTADQRVQEMKHDLPAVDEFTLEKQGTKWHSLGANLLKWAN